MNLSTDLLIIGAGPAGISAALTAEKFGLKSTIIDRAIFPRDKICGDGILLNDIKNIFNRINIDFSKFININQHFSPPFFIISNNNNFEFKAPIPSVIIRRSDFDNILWNNLSRNEEKHKKIDGIEIKSISKVNENYEVKCIHKESSIIISTKYIIASDGYSSYVRRNFFKNFKLKKRIASRYYCTVKKDINFPTSIIFDHKITPGYFWFFKINETTYNTGVYLAEDSKSDIYDLHNFYLKKYFNTELTKEKFNTWPIPYNQDLNNLVNDNILLTGDAAGLCDKMFGHGIDNAVTSGYLAVLSIFDRLNPNINFPLEEIYSYNMNMYIGDHLKKSFTCYQQLNENSENFSKIIKQYF